MIKASCKGRWITGNEDQKKINRRKAVRGKINTGAAGQGNKIKGKQMRVGKQKQVKGKGKPVKGTTERSKAQSRGSKSNENGSMKSKGKVN